MDYKLVFTKQAVKTLQRMPANIAKAIYLKMEKISQNPFESHSNVTKLQNREGYRLRVGDWRIIYEVQQEKIIVLVLKIGLRKEVYR
jgi:mRNA interferase RelE/StbE